MFMCLAQYLILMSIYSDILCYAFLVATITYPLLASLNMSRRWGFVHIAKCRESVTNGSIHWILRQPDQVSKIDTMARGT